MVRKNPQILFDFQPAADEEAKSDGTVSPLSEVLRERSVSADTLTNEDPLTPTPTQSGEELSSARKEKGEVETNDEGNLINLNFSDKDKAKASAKLNLLELKDALEGFDDDEDEASSLLNEPSGEKEELASSRTDEKPPSSQGVSEIRDDLLSSSYGSDDFNVNSLDSLGDLKMGQVICIGDKKTGTIRYIGPTDFAPGVWIGVELDTPSGKESCYWRIDHNDANKKGGFVVSMVTKHSTVKLANVNSPLSQ